MPESLFFFLDDSAQRVHLVARTLVGLLSQGTHTDEGTFHSLKTILYLAPTQGQSDYLIYKDDSWWVLTLEDH